MKMFSKLKMLHFVFLFFLILDLSAQEEQAIRYLQFTGFDFRGLDAGIIRQLRTATYSIGMELPNYEIIIGNRSSDGTGSIAIDEVKLRVLPITWRNGLSQGFYLEGVIYDTQTGEVKNHIKRTRIQEQQLVFTYGNLIRRLFGPREVNPEALPDFEFSQLPTPPPSLSPPAKDKPDKPTQDKQEQSEDQVNDDPVNDNPEAPVVSEDEEAKEEPEEEPEKPKRPNEVAISNFESPDVDLTRGENPIKSESRSWEFIHRFIFGLSYNTESISSENVIEVENDFINAGIHAHHFMNLDGSKSNLIRSRISMMRPQSETNFKFKARVLFGSYFHLSRFTPFFQPYIGLSRNSSSFVNLAQRGGGLRNFNTSTIWNEWGVVVDLTSLSLGTMVGFSIGTTLSSSTNYTAIDDTEVEMEGELKSFFIFQKIWRKISLFAELRTYSFRSPSIQAFENRYTEQALGITYSF
jgi:hypothetical protein